VPLTGQQLDATHEGKRLRVKFRDGDIAEIKLLSVALPNKYDRTPESWGIVYEVSSTGRKSSGDKTPAFWARIDEIDSFELMEEGNE